MILNNLRKSIFHLQQALREKEYKNDPDLLKALNQLAKKELRDVNDPNNYNTTEI
jgi:hypothetical protein